MEMHTHIQQLGDELDAAERHVALLRIAALKALFQIPEDEAAGMAADMWREKPSTQRLDEVWAERRLYHERT